MNTIKDQAKRLWYIQAAIEHGWSRSVLVMQIEAGLYRRQGKAITNFTNALPAHPSDNPTVGLILCKGKKELVVEYALRKLATPMGIGKIRYLETLPAELKGSLPSIEEIEAELGSA